MLELLYFISCLLIENIYEEIMQYLKRSKVFEILKLNEILSPL